jgi:hypothetical protein
VADVAAAVMRDPREHGHVGRVRDGVRHPAAGIDGGDPGQ